MKSDPYTRYFKIRLSEPYGSAPKVWGSFALYVDASLDGDVGRHIQLFENGVALAYDDTHVADKYGCRYGDRVSSWPPMITPITQEEFEQVWKRRHNAINRLPPYLKKRQ